MSLARSFDVSASGLTAERTRMDVISENLANANTTRVEGQPRTPYRRKRAVLEAVEPSSFSSVLAAVPRGASAGGVRVAAIEPDNGPTRRVRDPGHPDADPDGWVEMPNVEPVTEMVELITASRAFDANVTAMNAAKQMQQRALEIGKA